MKNALLAMLTVALVVGLLAVPAAAQQCRSVVVGQVVTTPTVTYSAPAVVTNHAVVTTPAVVVKEVVPTIAVQTLLLPVYGAAYVGSQPAAQQQTDPALVELLKKMDARLSNLEKQPAPQQPQPQPMPQPQARGPQSGPSVAAAKCAACHDTTVADAKGGGFAMFANGALALDDRGALAAIRKARLGKMPPANNRLGIAPLSDEEFARFSDEIEVRK